MESSALSKTMSFVLDNDVVDIHVYIRDKDMYTDEMKYRDEGQSTWHVRFSVGGYLWENWSGGKTPSIELDTVNAIIDGNTDSVEKFVDDNFYGTFNFSRCVTNPGRKRPPQTKAEKVKAACQDEIRRNAVRFCEMLLDIHADADAIWGGGSAKDDEIKDLKQKLEAAEREAGRTDIEALIMQNVVAALTPHIVETVQAKMGEAAGVIPTELKVRIGNIINDVSEGVRHKKFELVLTTLVAGEPVWLKGDAGTGKSFMCQQIAEGMGAEYYCTGSIMDEYSGLKGFIDANGVKHGTEFTRALDAMETGREVVMVFDEADGSTPEIMLAVNNFLAGGTIECMGHAYKLRSNLHIVACGNTNGRGGDLKYTRSIIDEATLDRFVFIEIGYDENIELFAAGGNREIADFCRSLRKAAATCGIDMLVTYRAIRRLAALSQVWDDRREVLNMCVIRGLDSSDLRTILHEMNLSGNIWRDELERMSEAA